LLQLCYSFPPWRWYALIMERKRILVVEDDAAIRRGIVDSLTFDGYAVMEEGDGRSGLDAALSAEVDLLLLDLVLPYHDGLTILDRVRQARPTLPVIILTARGDEADRIKGLKLGADDYVVKPFSVRELLARVEAVLRRSPQRSHDVGWLALPTGKVNLTHGDVVFTDGTQMRLSQREVELLQYLASQMPRTISREELLSNVWRIDARGAETRTIDMHVARLREKLRDNNGEHHVILTVHGKGYTLGQECVMEG